MKQCKKCGFKWDDEDNVCIVCGETYVVMTVEQPLTASNNDIWPFNATFPLSLEEYDKQFHYSNRIATNGLFTVGIKSNGSLCYDELYASTHNQKLRTIGNEDNIVMVRCNDDVVVTLHRDGTVSCIPNVFKDFPDVYEELSRWKNIVSIDIGESHIVGLKNDGTVVACGDNIFEQCNVQTWRDIVAIFCGTTHTVGINLNGEVVVTDIEKVRYKDESDIDEWKDIVSIACGEVFDVGIKCDGTVVFAGWNLDELNVKDWKNVAAVSCDELGVIGLKRNGKVLASLAGCEWSADDIADWEDIVAVDCSFSYAVGLKRDGVVISTLGNHKKQILDLELS